MFNDRYADQAKSLLRIVAALLFLLHGTSKLFGFPPSVMPQPEPGSLLWLGALLELIGGGLLVIGLFSRPVAFILSGEMAVAYFMFHAPKSPFPSVNAGDAAILFCFVFLYIAAAGPGPWAIDGPREEDEEPGVEGYAAPGGERQYRPEDFGDKVI
ncbi:MAG: DoxX family protein [Sphingomonas bacterium]|nr:DoxX family protein [Sphingomonas bacterium]